MTLLQIEGFEFMSNLVTVAPVVGVLVWVVFYFKGRVRDLEEKIEELQQELRQSEKDAIASLNNLNNTLRELLNKITR